MNLIDTALSQIDDGLRSLFARPSASRAMPRAATGTLSDAERDESVRLMRVNHVGEICAQALYQGQMLFAREPQTLEALSHAAREERDHLAWCAERVTELGGRTSVLGPAFYAGAWTLGAISGLAGDRWSLGFLVETERQVEAHLDDHLDRIPAADHTSREVVLQMRRDEIEHGNKGVEMGAAALPTPIRAAMKFSSAIMTRTTYWV